MNLVDGLVIWSIGVWLLLMLWRVVELCSKVKEIQEYHILLDGEGRDRMCPNLNITVSLIFRDVNMHYSPLSLTFKGSRLIFKSA